MAKNIDKLAANAKKKAKPARRATSVSELKLGGEPVVNLAPSKVELARLINWYNAMATPEHRVSWLVEYMEWVGNFSKAQIATVKARGKKFPQTFAFVARLLRRGTQLADHHILKLHDELDRFLGKTESEDELDEEGNLIATNKPKKVKVDNSIALATPFVDVIEADMEKILDNQKVEKSIYQKLFSMGCTPAISNTLRDYFKPQASEWLAVASGKDEQLNEGYAHVTIKQKRAMSDFLIQLMADLNSFQQVKKAQRKSRAPKPESMERMVKYLKFQKESKEFKLASVDPTKIIGAKQLWLFNTKNRMLTYYTAGDEKGLRLKGSTLQNYTIGESKKLRKPELVLPNILGGTKINNGNTFKNLTTTAIAVTGRINKDTILLKVL